MVCFNIDIRVGVIFDCQLSLETILNVLGNKTIKYACFYCLKNAHNQSNSQLAQTKQSQAQDVILASGYKTAVMRSRMAWDRFSAPSHRIYNGIY